MARAASHEQHRLRWDLGPDCRRLGIPDPLKRGMCDGGIPEDNFMGTKGSFGRRNISRSLREEKVGGKRTYSIRQEM